MASEREALPEEIQRELGRVLNALALELPPSVWEDATRRIWEQAAKALALGREQGRQEGRARFSETVNDLHSQWTVRRGHDTDLSFAARLGCDEDLREAIEGREGAGR